METSEAPFDAALKRAGTLYDVGKYELAIRFAIDAIAANPSHAGAHVILANSNERLGRLPDAQAAAQRAIALDPDFAPAYVAFGMARHSAAAYPEALEAFTRAIRLNPRYADAYRLAAHTQMNQRRYREALVTVRQALAINPNSVAAHEVQAICLRRLGRTGEAEIETANVLHMRPESVLGLRQHGHLRLKRGDRKIALSAFREAIRLDPNSAHARADYLAAVLPYKLGRFGPAIAAWCGFGLIALGGQVTNHYTMFLLVWLGLVIAFTGRPLTFEAMRRDPIARSIVGAEVLATNRRCLSYLGASALAAMALWASHAVAAGSLATGLLLASAALGISVRPSLKALGRTAYRLTTIAVVGWSVVVGAFFQSALAEASKSAIVVMEMNVVLLGYLLCWIVAAVVNRYAAVP